MICRHTYDSDAVERQEAPPKDQRKQVASHRIPGRGSSQQPARNFRMATSPHVEEQRAIEAHIEEEAEANYAASTGYSGTLDRQIPIARKVEVPDEKTVRFQQHGESIELTLSMNTTVTTLLHSQTTQALKTMRMQQMRPGTNP